jgi:aspartate ammonia-lyase
MTEQTERIEHDLLGERAVPAQALYGVHTVRALENFPLSGRRVHPALIHAYGVVKQACLDANHELGQIRGEVYGALGQACQELTAGALDEQIVVDALQGGAGTSTNMNVNEVLANRALQLLGRRPGEYAVISPLDTVNLHQSTNDTYPTALKVAGIWLLRELETEIVALQEAFQAREGEFADIVKVGRTQLQDAVLVTLGRECGAWAEAFCRDRWRIYKCEERLRTVNLGGTAVGTGLAAPRRYIFRVVDHLREITGLGLARAENLMECTQNADVFVEVSGILKACATNLIKICTDLRLLSSGPDAGLGELRLPQVQAGSSIMPGKVNPVIPEAATQVGMQVCANDQAIAQAASMGNLELNAFLPLIADRLLESLALLAAGARMLRTRCVEGLQPDADRCRAQVHSGTAALTALIDSIGYERAQEIGRYAREQGVDVRQAGNELGLVTLAEFDQLTAPESVNRLGSPDPAPPDLVEG